MTIWPDHEAVLESGTTGWREAGAGEPLLFLHGLGGTRGSWNPQLQQFSATRRCIAWDMPGYGVSAGEESLTYERIADRVVELLDHLEVERADMVGLSFGGMHALHTALNHPSRVGRLVLADTSPAFGMNGTSPEEWKKARTGAMDAGETPATIAAPILDAIVATPLSPEVRSDLIAAFGRIPVDGFRAAVDCLPHNDVRDRLHLIEQQALVIVGELDEETPVEYAQVLHDGLPNSTMVVLPGVGHLSPSEDSAAFNQHAARFLTGDFE
jgi:3-oxoadipate enol-lactonase